MDERKLQTLEIKIVDAQLRIANQCLLVQKINTAGHVVAARSAVELLELLKGGLRQLQARRRMLLRDVKKPISQKRASSIKGPQRLRMARDARELIGIVADVVSKSKR